MKRNKEQQKTAHLILAPYDPATNEDGIEAQIAGSFAAADGQTGDAEILIVRDRKRGEAIGAVKATAKDGQTVEIDLQLFVAENGEKIAAETLRAAARYLFSTHKDLLVIETWLNPDLSAIRILEKAGFERFFEEDGVVRYERHRPHFPFLSLCMLLFTGAGILCGYLTGNYPLFAVIGIASGILPGALAEYLSRKRRSKTSKIPR